MSPCQYIQSLYPSPVGVLRIIANNAGLIGILWDKEDGTRIKLPQLLACSGSNAYIHITRKWLDRYFSHASNQTVFPALPPLILSQFTALEKATILALNTIPFGTTLSYKDMAQKIGNPRAVRAVASAIGKNPYSILLPCHRVIQKNGKLGGFAGGLANKSFLLEYEHRIHLLTPHQKTPSETHSVPSLEE